MSKEKFNFKKAYEELEKITREFENNEVDLDEGVKKFQQALELAAKLKEHLSQTENQIEEIKKKFNNLRNEANN